MTTYRIRYTQEERVERSAASVGISTDTPAPFTQTGISAE